MILRAFRLTKARFARQAWDGEGARRFGGRWNSPGTRVVYASATLSLAVLEILVNLQDPRPLAAFASLELEFDDALVTVASSLPADWRSSAPSAATRAIGDAWARQADSAVLAVPSAVVPADRNFLLNPAHPDFRRIRRHPPRPFDWDPRLVAPR